MKAWAARLLVRPPASTALSFIEPNSLLKNLGNLSFFVSVARLIRCQVLCSLA